jgi:hypothetical protein
MSDADNTLPCPFCRKPIDRRAERCPFCGEVQFEHRPRRSDRDSGTDEAVRWLIPIDRSGWAIASGYCGLLACFPFVGLLFGILGIVTGILALQHSKRNPRLGGQGRAIFGIVMGGLAGAGNALLVLLLIVGAFSK